MVRFLWRPGRNNTPGRPLQFSALPRIDFVVKSEG